jgi:ATP/maltotriose-dependent transcriptional regulator MalT
MAVGNVHWQRGDPAQAIEMLETSRRYGEQANFAVAGAWTRAYQARIYGHLGQIERGLELAQAAVAHAEQYVPPWQVLALGVLAQLYLFAGNLEKAAEILQDCESCHPSAWGRFLAIFQLDEPTVQLALARGDPIMAVDLADKMMAKIRRFDYRIYLPDALYLRSQTLLAAGRAEEAGDSLQEAYREAEALQARWALWQVLAGQAKIEAERGNIADAESLRAQAGELVTYIADRAGSNQLRASFLARVDVQAVLQEENLL